MPHIEIGKFIISNLKWNDVLIGFVRVLTFLTPLKLLQAKISISRFTSSLKTGIKKLMKLKSNFKKPVFLNYSLYKIKAVRKPRIVRKPMRYPPSS